MVPIDPIAAERVGYNAGKSIDRLAKTALDVASVTYDDATTTSIQEIGSSTDVPELVPSPRGCEPFGRGERASDGQRCLRARCFSEAGSALEG